MLENIDYFSFFHVKLLQSKWAVLLMMNALLIKLVLEEVASTLVEQTTLAAHLQHVQSLITNLFVTAHLVQQETLTRDVKFVS